MSYQFTNVALIEPVSAADGMLKGNAALYNVINGCAPTYSASNMTVTCAAGTVTHNGAGVSVTGGAAFWTLVADVSNPRWTWLAVDSTGAAVVVSGTAAATPSVPALGDRVAIALVRVEAGQTIANNIATKIDKRIPAVENRHFYNYKTADQTITSSTTYTDVTGVLKPSSLAGTATFSFDAVANGVYAGRYVLPMYINGTAPGLKLQFTGPSSPTKVSWSLVAQNNKLTSISPDYTSFINTAVLGVNSFSSDTQFNTGDVTTAGLITGLYVIDLFVANGANSGAVTLQWAQRASSATAIGIYSGAYMDVRRIA